MSPARLPRNPIAKLSHSNSDVTTTPLTTSATTLSTSTSPLQTISPTRNQPELQNGTSLNNGAAAPVTTPIHLRSPDAYYITMSITRPDTTYTTLVLLGNSFPT
jgi:hypothetical protein